MLPVQEPQSKVSVAGKPMFQPPLLAWVQGIFQTSYSAFPASSIPLCA
jgi:hypothetical protein